MTRKFNVTGVCVPHLHYMVDTSKKMTAILSLIKNGAYFNINRPRQFGKTTTLTAITNKLKQQEDYICLDTSFEGLGEDAYKTVKNFIAKFINQIRKQLVFQKIGILLEFLNQNDNLEDYDALSLFITNFCLIENKKIVLLIDEVDKSMNNQLFLDFLAMLRQKYLDRAKGTDTTFHSIVLAGVHDVKTLKVKIKRDTDEKYNSPWNIAADFTVDMSFDPAEIATMLIDYSADKQIEMDIPAISERIYLYTSGYPFLVSRICKEIDEGILVREKKNNWTVNDVDKSVKTIIGETNTNFESLIKNIENSEALFSLVENLIIGYRSYNFVISEPTTSMAFMYGIIDKHVSGKIKIHNKIYEEYMTNHIMAKYEIHGYKDEKPIDVVQSTYIKPNGKLDIEKVLLKFQEVIKEKYSKSDILKSDEFLEKDLRLLFLVFLKPIINGIGFAFKEVETSEEKRLDIVILFRDEKFIVELKLWRGNEYHQQGIGRLKDYMRREGAGRGFMLIMDKSRHKEFTSNVEEEILMVWI